MHVRCVSVFLSVNTSGDGCIFGATGNGPSGDNCIMLLHSHHERYVQISMLTTYSYQFFAFPLICRQQIIKGGLLYAYSWNKSTGYFNHRFQSKNITEVTEPKLSSSKVCSLILIMLLYASIESELS